MDTKSLMITGATGAVGRRLLDLARSAGCDVLGIYHRNQAQAEAAYREWAEVSGSLQMKACDLTDTDQVNELIARLPGTYCPDALIHLAAPKLDVRALHRFDWDEYQRQIDGVLKPVVLLTRPLLKRMVRKGSGRVISVLSAVVLGTPPRGFTSYTVAKYALAGYMKCLATEYAGRGITANTVSPGPMNTDMLRDLPVLLTDQMRKAIPGGNWIDPDSVARAVFWLAMQAGSELTGCNLSLTSGMSV
jgi:NAD(P)-dependent dehydrogenase (short-subunit alcohol dehydrogenase family)